MRKIVSNTTPILSLLKLGKLDLLEKLYGKIYVPTEVFNEIEAGRSKKYYKDLSSFDWIKIREIQNKRSIKYFLDLDAGEAEAIILATELHADLILLDEKLGRFHARYADLKVTGTIGILARAKSKGFIEELNPLLNELSDKGVWISKNLKTISLKNRRNIVFFC